MAGWVYMALSKRAAWEMKKAIQTLTVEVTVPLRIAVPIPEEDVISVVAGRGGRVVEHRVVVLHPLVSGLCRCCRSRSMSPILCATEPLCDGEGALSQPRVRPRPTPRHDDYVLRLRVRLVGGASGSHDASAEMRWYCSDQVEVLALS